MKILLDTNFLVYCAKQKIDYAEEIINLTKGESVVLSSVVLELKKLAEKAKKARDKDAAKLALQILGKNIKENKIKVLQAEEKADETIISLAGKQDIVATLDKELKNRLKGKARILTIRRGKKLEIL